MPETVRATDPWHERSAPATPFVPARYRGIWRRTLLQTPTTVDESSWVRWLQLGHWHADLRVPEAARAVAAGRPQEWPYDTETSVRLRRQQGFAGMTQVETGVGGEVCTWHRLVDYHPPGVTPDAGHMSFDGPDRVIEVGLHGVYREVWQRLDGSTGRYLALAEPAYADGRPGARLFVAGRYLMRVHPCTPSWHPAFEISFGELKGGRWHIERSTRPELEGRKQALRWERIGLDQAQVTLDNRPARPWHILEWDE